MSANKRFFFRLILLIIVASIVGTTIYVSQMYRISTPTTPFVFKVEEGESAHDVARKLKQQGIIPFRTFFYIGHFLFAREKAIAPGGYEFVSGMPLKQVIGALEGRPWAAYVTIPPSVSKDQMGEILGKALGWDELDREFFSFTLAGMQWQRYHERLEKEFLKRFSWTKVERESFLSLSAMYKDDEYDFLKNIYEPGTYQIPVGASRAQTAGVIIDQFAAVHGDDEYLEVLKRIDETAMDNIANLIAEEMELMPDIVALPPGDITLKKEDGRTYLLFSTEYWNKGRGPVELVADPKTKNIREDVERKVFQRIYRLDGDYRERLAGTFLWHQEHLHYHFIDFAEYTLAGLDPETGTFKEVNKAKSTFCIRDSEPIDLAHPGAGRTPSYTVCGKERQGISPGWSDAYYYNYIDQRMDVTDAPKGQYLLTIMTNPEDRIEEITKENNKGEALIFLNVADNLVEVIEERNYGK
jgi:hypothetical protein